MGELLHFPNKRKITAEEKVNRLEHRLNELETENGWARSNITDMGEMLEANIKEMQELLHELAVLQGFEEKFENEEIEQFYRDVDDSDDIEPEF